MTTREDFFEHAQECMICKEMLKKNESRFPKHVLEMTGICSTGYNLVVAVWWNEDNTEEEWEVE